MLLNPLGKGFLRVPLLLVTTLVVAEVVSSVLLGVVNLVPLLNCTKTQAVNKVFFQNVEIQTNSLSSTFWLCRSNTFQLWSRFWCTDNRTFNTFFLSNTRATTSISYMLPNNRFTIFRWSSYYFRVVSFGFVSVNFGV